MREIKFRSWHNVDWVMYYNHSVCMAIDGSVSFLNKSGKWEKDDDGSMIELMQYTGLLDKNKKEIYEGDILQDKEGDLLIVENWEGAVFRLVIYGMTWEFLFQAESKGLLRDELEIIGNVHENPEIINKIK